MGVCGFYIVYLGLGCLGGIWTVSGFGDERSTDFQHSLVLLLGLL